MYQLHEEYICNSWDHPLFRHKRRSRECCVKDVLLLACIVCGLQVCFHVCFSVFQAEIRSNLVLLIKL